MGDRDRVDVESTVDMLGSPPAVDPAAMETARARTQARLFGTAEPPRIGRYEILETIGGGGMGVVYSALDPQLQRKVALKVLQPHRDHDKRAQQRMLVEARALAKLDHPNVVKVYDAMIENDQVVVVMELLEGETLERWTERESRGWSDVVAVYAPAADGLAAAHVLGVVHRDFKPSNAIVGHDGRVRVVDFGLARLVEVADPPSSGGVTARGDLTATGDVVGTLAYASPEQLAGREVTAATDQFSLCVALHASIEGVPPFTGFDRLARLASIERAAPQRARDGRRLPAWLRAVVDRGLSADAARRFPAMRDLARELRRTRGWRRWRLPMLAMGVLGATIATTAAVSRPAESPCDGGAALVETAWNTSTRQQISAAIERLATPYASEVQKRVVDVLDRYATDWTSAHAAACRAHQRGDTSSLLVDRQMTCLARRLGALRAAASVLAVTDARSLPQVMDVATAVPSPAPCLDLELVQGDAAPPDSVAARIPLDAARARINAAEAFARAGRADTALAELREARTIADGVDYPPLHVEILLAEGRIQLARGEMSRATEVLRTARQAAFEATLLPAAVEASARLIYAEGSMAPNLDRLDGELATLMPLSAGLRGDHFVLPLLLNNVGTVYLAAGRRSDAAHYFEKAKDEIRRHDVTDLELVTVDLNLAMITSDTPKREAIARGAWERLRTTLGEQHLVTLDALSAYGMYVADPADALDSLSSVVALYERFHPAATGPRALALARSAFLAAEIGDVARSTQIYARAIDVRGVTDPDVIMRQAVCRGELALQRGSAAVALAELRAVFDAKHASANWWERADALRAEVGMGQAAAALGDDEGAIRYLDAAVLDLPAIIALNEEVEPKRYLARAKLALARTLARAKRDPVRVKLLEAEASAFYRDARYPTTR